MHAKNSEKVPVTTSAEGERSFKTILTQQKKEDDGNTRLEFGKGTCNDERRRRAKFKGRFYPRKRRRRL